MQGLATGENLGQRRPCSGVRSFVLVNKHIMALKYGKFKLYWAVIAEKRLV